MSNHISEFENHYSVVTAEIINETNRLKKISKNERPQVESNIEKLLLEAKELLEQLDLEIKNLKGVERERNLNRLQSFLVELSKLERDYCKSKKSINDNSLMREELLGNEDFQNFENMKSNLLSNAEKLEESSNKLDTGLRTCLQTEQIGIQILEDLNVQKGTLQRAKDRLHRTNDEIGKSSRVLTSMIRKSLQNRVIIIIMTIVTIIIIIFSVYFVIRKKI